MKARDIVRSHPDMRGRIDQALLECIEACFTCARACTTCADACLAEDMVGELRQCIRLDLDCADICILTGRLASRRTSADEAVLRHVLHLCAVACRTCAEECERHADTHEHCRICAEACRDCQRACEEAIADGSRQDDGEEQLTPGQPWREGP